MLTLPKTKHLDSYVHWYHKKSNSICEIFIVKNWSGSRITLTRNCGGGTRQFFTCEHMLFCCHNPSLFILVEVLRFDANLPPIPGWYFEPCVINQLSPPLSTSQNLLWTNLSTVQRPLSSLDMCCLMGFPRWGQRMTDNKPGRITISYHRIIAQNMNQQGLKSLIIIIIISGPRYQGLLSWFLDVQANEC